MFLTPTSNSFIVLKAEAATYLFLLSPFLAIEPPILFSNAHSASSFLSLSAFINKN